MRSGFSISWRDYLREFLLGATTPSLPALVGTIGVAVTVILLFLVFLTPDFMEKNGYYFMENSQDDYAYLTTKTLQISKTPPTAVPLSVVLIGNSDSQEGLDAKYLEQTLLEETQFPVVVHKLTVGGLFLWEKVCVLDRIRDKLWGVVVLQVQPSYLALDRKHLKGGITRHSRLAFYCPAFDEEMQLAGVAPPQWKNNYFLDNYKFFIARIPSLLLNLIRGPRQWSESNAEKWRPPTQHQWEMAVKNSSQWRNNYPIYHKENFKVYARLIENLRKNKRVQIALLEGVMNPKVMPLVLSTPEVKQSYDQYDADMRGFTQDMDVPYWNLEKEANFKPTDFIDHVHIKESAARKRYTKILATKLASRLIDLHGIREIRQ